MSLPAQLLTAVVTGSLAAGGAARADTARHDACSGPEIHFEQQLNPAWESAASVLRNDLAGQAGLDRCAVVTLLPAGDEVIVQVELADGRSAVRRVRTAAELAWGVEALLMVPPSTPRDAVDSAPVMVAEAWPERSSMSDRSPPVPLSPTVAHVELGFGGGGRASGSPLFWGAGAQFVAQVSLSGWLIGAEGRWDVFDAPVSIAVPAGFNMQTVGVGVQVGRRIENGALRVDVLLGPELLVENEEASGTGDGIGGTSNDVRLHLMARWLGARTKSPRWFGAIDADVSPARVRHTVQTDPGLPSAPAWSAGLGVGLLLEVL